jgi:hypothetical protein
MTCIAALKHEDSIWMAGDSAGVGGLSIVTRSDKKVFLKEDSVGNQFGFGFTHSFRMGQLLQYHLNVPALPSDCDVHEYMVTTLIPAIRLCLKEGGFTTINNNEETGGQFIVAVRGHIFFIDEDFQVGENLPEFSSCGCGEDLALGALYATRDLKLAPKKRLTIALSAAQEFSAGVRAPFNVIEVKSK